MLSNLLVLLFVVFFEDSLLNNKKVDLDLTIYKILIHLNFMFLHKHFELSNLQEQQHIIHVKSCNIDNTVFFKGKQYKDCYLYIIKSMKWKLLEVHFHNIYLRFRHFCQLFPYQIRHHTKTILLYKAEYINNFQQIFGKNVVAIQVDLQQL